MKRLTILLKPASAACNLRCRYCFYADVAAHRHAPACGAMAREDMAAMLAALEPQLEPGDAVSFAFQGGEPTLVGLDWYQDFVRRTRRWDPAIRVEYALQTNATLLDGDWCRFLAQEDFLVGLSLDLLPRCHDEARGDGTYRRVLAAMAELKRQGARYNVLCTLTRQVARHPRQVWRVLEELDIRYVQFTPCLEDLDAPETGPYALTPERFGQFYTQLFGLWLADFQKGHYRSVKLFDDVVNLMAYGLPTACGIQGVCQPQLVVEADGSVYPCDFYCLDQYRLGSILESPLEDLLRAARAAHRRRARPLPAVCGGCPYANFCGGGCQRARQAVTGDGPCGYRTFLDSAGPALLQIARQQRQATGGRPGW